MRVAVGSDHRGYLLKSRIIELLGSLGHEISDKGANSADSSVDYPDYAFQVAELVGKGKADRGILICATGIGMTIAANKVPGVRAAHCHDILSAEISRSHIDSNIMCLSGDLLGEDLVDRMVRTWISTPFDGGRHQRRVEKISKFETEQHGEGR